MGRKAQRLPAQCWVSMGTSPCSATEESCSFWPQTSKYKEKKEKSAISLTISLSRHFPMLSTYVSNLPTTLPSEWHFPNSIDEQAEAQRSEVMDPKSWSEKCLSWDPLAVDLTAPDSRWRELWVQSLTALPTAEQNDPPLQIIVLYPHVNPFSC